MKIICDGLEKILWFGATVCLAVFSFLTFAQFVSRGIGHPIVWAEEIARFCFIYMVFLGSTVGIRRSSHYSFNVFAKCKSHIVILITQFTVLILEFMFLAFLFYTSMQFIPQMLRRASSTLRIPIAVPYSSIVIFAGIGCIFMLEIIFLYIRNTMQERETTL